MKPPFRQAQVLPSPVAGVHGEWLHCARAFGRHGHDSHGLGVMEAVAGHIITSHPGEVHDGHPLQQAPWRWRMIHITRAAMAVKLALSKHSGKHSDR